jgi:hypothetical protein
MTYSKNNIYCLLSLLLFTSLITCLAQSDSSNYSKSIAISLNKPFGKVALNTLPRENITYTTPQFASFHIQSRFNLISKQKINWKIALGFGAQILTQNSSYENLASGDISTHEFSFTQFSFNTATVLEFNLFEKDPFKYGLDLIPGLDIPVIRISDKSTVYDDYTSPSIGNEIAIFELYNTQKIIPFIDLNFWMKINENNHQFKPFVGIRLTNYSSETSLTRTNSAPTLLKKYRSEYFWTCGLIYNW